MIEVMAIAFEEMGFDLVYHFTSNSLIISYTLGVILTLIVVVFSAWRVGRLNIVRAIRDIPEPQRAGKRGIKGLIISILLPLLGLMMILSGLGAKQAAPYMLGGSLTIIGLCLLARRFRLPDRAAYTLAGAGLLVFWLMPFDWHPYSEEMSSGMEMFTLSGIFHGSRSSMGSYVQLRPAAGRHYVPLRTDQGAGTGAEDSSLLSHGQPFPHRHGPGYVLPDNIHAGGYGHHKCFFR